MRLTGKELDNRAPAAGVNEPTEPNEPNEPPSPSWPPKKHKGPE